MVRLLLNPHQKQHADSSTTQDIPSTAPTTMVMTVTLGMASTSSTRFSTDLVLTNTSPAVSERPARFLARTRMM